MPNWITTLFSRQFWIFDGWDLLQVALSIIGFVIAYRQLIKTKNSIESAKEATKETQNSIQDQFSIIESYEIANGIKILKENINSQKFGISRWLLDDISIKLIQLSKRHNYLVTEEDNITLRNMIKFLSNLESLIINYELGKEELDIMNINIRLSEMMRDLYGWTEAGKFQ